MREVFAAPDFQSENTELSQTLSLKVGERLIRRSG